MVKDSEISFVYYQLLFQVMFVGMTVGLFRTVVPALAEDKFNIPADSFLLLGTFIIVFGLVKSTLNLVAGKLSDRVGRRSILISGWVFALPIPFLLAYAESWTWIIYASTLLGINQGFCWSMSQTMKLDISHPSRYGTTVGLNETFGYGGVAITSYLSAWATSAYGMKLAMLVLGLTTIVVALILAFLFCKETRQDHTPAKLQEQPKQANSNDAMKMPRHNISPRSRQIALCFSGMATKFIDTLVWLIYPVFLYQNGISLINIGIVSSVYTLVWGLGQLVMGRLSDSIGRKHLITIGITLCAIASFIAPMNFHLSWWIINASVLGIGTAMFYPTMSAAVNDVADHGNRGSVLGIYRFWRDFGYFSGAIVLGSVVAVTQQQELAFYCVSIILLFSILLLLRYLPNTDSHQADSLH